MMKPAERKLFSESFNKLLNEPDNINYKKEVNTELQGIIGEWQGPDAELKLALNTLEYAETHTPSTDDDRIVVLTARVIASTLLLNK